MYEIYSKDNCSYCDKIKELFKFHKVEYRENNLKDGYTKEEIQNRVGETKKINTVPQIFLNNEHVGGYLEILEHFAYDQYQKNRD